VVKINSISEGICAVCDKRRLNQQCKYNRCKECCSLISGYCSVFTHASAKGNNQPLHLNKLTHQIDNAIKEKKDIWIKYEGSLFFNLFILKEDQNLELYVLFNQLIGFKEDIILELFQSESNQVMNQMKQEHIQ
jgi:hypothetical protein